MHFAGQMKNAHVRRGNPWWVVCGSVLALTVGQGPVMFFTFGTFIGPITTEFGWNRGALSSALLIGYAIAAVVSAMVGKLIDRYGVRRVTLPFLILFALTGMLIPLTPPSL